MNEGKSYMIKFNKYKTMKFKIYLFDYAINSKNKWQIIVIIYNKYIFSINNGVRKA